MTENCNIESLLVAFLQAALAAHPAEPVSATEFLKYFAPDIAHVGRVFKFLGLAEESTESSLGWQPTDQLIRILASGAKFALFMVRTQSCKGNQRHAPS